MSITSYLVKMKDWKRLTYWTIILSMFFRLLKREFFLLQPPELHSKHCYKHFNDSSTNLFIHHSVCSHLHLFICNFAK